MSEKGQQLCLQCHSLDNFLQTGFYKAVTDRAAALSNTAATERATDNKSNSTASAIQAEANRQEQLSDYLQIIP